MTQLFRSSIYLAPLQIISSICIGKTEYMQTGKFFSGCSYIPQIRDLSIITPCLVLSWTHSLYRKMGKIHLRKSFSQNFDSGGCLKFRLGIRKSLSKVVLPVIRALGAECKNGTISVIERRSVTSRYHGRKISG